MSVTHDTMTCQCGAKIKMASNKRHLLSKKHQKYVATEQRIAKEIAERELKLPEGFWKIIEDRFESDLSFNTYSKNLEILMGEWSEEMKFNGKAINEDRLFDMEEAYLREFKDSEGW